MGGDSQWQSATTDESQQCAFKTYKRREKRTDFKNAFQALQEGSLKTMNGNQSKNLPQQPAMLFWRDSPDCSDFYLINPKSDWALPVLNPLLPSSLFGHWKKCLHHKGLCIRIKRKTHRHFWNLWLTSKFQGVLSRKVEMTVRQVYTSSLDSLKMLTELGRLDLWQ